MNAFDRWWDTTEEEGFEDDHAQARSAYLAAVEACITEVKAAGCSCYDQDGERDPLEGGHFGNCPQALAIKLLKLLEES